MDCQEAYLNVRHHIGNALASLRALSRHGEINQSDFEDNVNRVIGTLERFLGEEIEGFPDRQILDSHRATFRIGYERLQQARYPDSVDEAIRLIQSLEIIVPIVRPPQNVEIWVLQKR